MYRLESRHHDSDLAGAGGGDDGVAVTVSRLACPQVFEVSAGMKGLFIA